MAHRAAADAGIGFDELAPASGREAGEREGVERIREVARAGGVVMLFAHAEVAVGELDPERFGFVCAAQRCSNRELRPGTRSTPAYAPGSHKVKSADA